MSFARYPAYKDSGVEWLGEVPEHWEVVRLKRACEVFPSNVDKHSRDGEPQVLLCNYTDVYYNEKITQEMTFMSASAAPDQISRFTLKAGDTIITKDSETADDIAISAYVPRDLPGVVCGYHLSMIRPRSEVSGAFMKRLFDSVYLKSKVAVAANGLTRVGLGQYAIDNLEVPLPPEAEQALVALFLDHETAKIDALVAEQERLIELLKEKRQAVISHAVTKGLDPSVPMKHSGVEWLGEVPAHWRVQPLGSLTTVIQTGPFGSQLHSDEYVYDATPVVNPSNIVDGQIRPDPSVTVTDEVVQRLAHQKLIAGDIVVGRRGEMGRCAVVEQSQAGWLCGTGSLRLHLTASAIPDFVWRYLTTDLIKQYLSLQSVGSTMENLNTEILARVPVPVPNVTEQSAICRAISEQLEVLNNLESAATKGVRFLQERRTALISATVTGQIDVRGWVPAEAVA